MVYDPYTFNEDNLFSKKRRHIVYRKLDDVTLPYGVNSTTLYNVMQEVMFNLPYFFLVFYIPHIGKYYSERCKFIVYKVYTACVQHVRVCVIFFLMGMFNLYVPCTRYICKTNYNRRTFPGIRGSYGLLVGTYTFPRCGVYTYYVATPINSP